jgi:uncharacterized protein YhhL (DUF1145 family)
MAPVDSMLLYNNYLHYLKTVAHSSPPDSKKKKFANPLLPTIPTYLYNRGDLRKMRQGVYTNMAGYVLYFVWLFILLFVPDISNRFLEVGLFSLGVCLLVFVIEYFILPANGKSKLEEIDISKTSVIIFRIQHILMMLPYLMLYYQLIKLIN